MENNRFDIREQKISDTEREFEKALRPLAFDDFNGQEKIIENLRVFVMAARMRQEPLDHVLLHGPPGLGKTTLANIVANELGVGFKITSGPVLDKPGDLAGLLTSLEENDVLFIDEIHRLSPVVEEYLYSAMEDFRIDIMIDQRAERAFHTDRIESFYAGGCDYPKRAIDESVACPIRDKLSFGILRSCCIDSYYRAVGQAVVRALYA